MMDQLKNVQAPCVPTQVSGRKEKVLNLHGNFSVWYKNATCPQIGDWFAV